MNDFLPWHCLETGEGPALLLLHGLGASSFSWRELIPRLALRFHLLAPDLPAHGATPAAATPDFRLPTLVDGLLALLDRRGIRRCAVAGNSLGGGLAVLLAARAPERVTALALLDPAVVLKRYPLLFQPLRLPGLGHLTALALGPWIVPWGLKLAYHRRELITPEVVAGYAPTFRPLANRLGLMRLARENDPWPPEEVKALLASLHQPVVILWGEEDPILPVSQAAQLHALLPRAELHLLPGVGHAPQEEAPEATAEILIAFLAAAGKNE
ncbi:MAG: alpha/beta fold hydrolase [Syntrophobacterales bacterium]|nr:alpha/beta fold hydrolase [Syntrophobacterales bacterium]